PTHEARLVVSLHRNGNYEEAYDWLKQFIRENKLIKKYLVGIDFCAIEEGNPPKLKKNFFTKINEDNQKEPELALSILYHVGESFVDKTPDSAVRWILEVAMYGAHRLGHCIALGIDPETYANTTRKESASEREDQITFILENYNTLREYGYKTEKKSLIQEKEKLQSVKEIEIYYKTEEIENLRALQEFGMDFLRNTPAVIEVCPTSNLLIGMIEKEENLPLKRFFYKKLKVTIGTDDPGIFQTNLHKEYKLCENLGVSKESLKQIQRESIQYKSKQLISYSSRKNNNP
ncbi:MAG: adenosine deaminase, partial [Leptospiraceae bacterium]|nr:adenosine deaminase [Leptospiraceae bacterium]